MKMARIARRNRLPDSLPVVIKLLEGHPEGLCIGEMQKAIEVDHLWCMGPGMSSRALYHRIYGVLKLLRSRGMVQQRETGGRESLWILDPETFARQRRMEVFEVIQPFVDGCLTISDSSQLLGQIHELIDDGTLDVMLAERRARGRRTP